MKPTCALICEFPYKARCPLICGKSPWVRETTSRGEHSFFPFPRCLKPLETEKLSVSSPTFILL